jgi:hypothetical protein
MAGVSWLIDGRKRYTGPRDLDMAMARARQERLDDAKY